MIGKNLNKRIIAIAFILLILVPSILLVPTHQSQVNAQASEILGGGFSVALFCSGLLNRLGGLISGLLGIVSLEVPVSDGQQRSKEGCLDHIAWLAANILIEETTRQTINWINGSTDGRPKYVTNVGVHLADIADRAVGEFLLTELPLVCSPFRLDVDLALRQRHIPERHFQCTLSEAFDNVTDFGDFLDGNFLRGGWDGWLSLTQRNNPYTALLAAENRLSSRIQGRQQIELAKLDWGSGFLAWEICDNNNFGCVGEVPNEAAGPAQSSGECEANLGTWQCLQPKGIATPGSVIEDQLNQVLGNTQDRLVVADEVNEIVSALLNRLITDVLTNPFGLFGSSSIVNDRSGSEVLTNNNSGGNLCDNYGVCDGVEIPPPPGSEPLPPFEGIPPTPEGAVCGDGVAEAPEQCDDGNTRSGDGCSNVCQLESGGGTPPPPPPPPPSGGSCVFFASNGGDHCDEDQNDFQSLLEDGANVRLDVLTGTGGTWFITPFRDMVSVPPTGGWLGNPNCQEYGNFGSNPPFPITMTFEDSDDGGTFTIPASSNGDYTLGVYGGSGAGNEARLCLTN